MPTFDIVKKSFVKDSFRVDNVKQKFELKIDNEVKEQFNGNIDIDNIDWNIGVICGASGTGKTTIAKHLFSDNFVTSEYDERPIIENMPQNKTVDEITKTFNSVGFATVWSWLKPYHVLSQGEQMRVNLANALLQDKQQIIFDEFTSVVNREVAKTASAAIVKSIKRTNKKFIAVTCHKDILEWLEPDWVFDTDDMSFKITRGLLRRPNIEIKIYQERNKWNIFKKYHYLSTNLNKSAMQYVGYFNNEPIVFFAVLHFPHLSSKKLKIGHRLVVLPDFQGLGIGHNFSSAIAQKYLDDGFRFIIRSSSNSLLYQRKKDKRWIIKDIGRTTVSDKYSTVKSLSKTIRNNKITVSYEYIGE